MCYPRKGEKMKMKKRALAAAAVLCLLSAALSGCTMQFSPGASALLGSGEVKTTGANSTTVQNSTPVTSGETTAPVESTSETDGETEAPTSAENTKPGETQASVTPDSFKCRELDIITSGSFYTECERTDENGELTSMTIANTPSSIYMLLPIADVPMGVLVKDGTTYMLNENDKTYMELNAVALKLMKIDPSELDVESIGSMPGIKPDSCEEINYKDGKKATRAVYTDGNSTVEVIARGDKMLEMNTIQDGKTVSSMSFTFVTDKIPEEKCSIPSSYKKSGLWAFFGPFLNQGADE